MINDSLWLASYYGMHELISRKLIYESWSRIAVSALQFQAFGSQRPHNNWHTWHVLHDRKGKRLVRKSSNLKYSSSTNKNWSWNSSVNGAHRHSKARWKQWKASGKPNSPPTLHSLEIPSTTTMTILYSTLLMKNLRIYVTAISCPTKHHPWYLLCKSGLQSSQIFEARDRPWSRSDLSWAYTLRWGLPNLPTWLLYSTR